jgi:hypothetical protein
MKPGGQASLPKNEQAGQSTELYVTAYRNVNPRQWLFKSRLTDKCLQVSGTGVSQGADTCNNYVVNDDLSVMFEFYGKKRETAPIKERGGACMQADAGSRPYATLVPCDFAATVRYDPTNGYLRSEGNMCITEGERRPAEAIKFPWGATLVRAFKLFWEKCADKTNDPGVYSRQMWMFDQSTGLITSSIAIAGAAPEAYCLVLSSNPNHWSLQTELLVLLPCRFVQPAPHEQTAWWTKAEAALAANTGGGPTMVEVQRMNLSSIDKTRLRKTTEKTTCMVSTHVLPGKKIAGTSEWTCTDTTSECSSSCGICSPGCYYLDWIGDGNCNPQCNNTACNFDCSAEFCDCVAIQAGMTVPATDKQAAFYHNTVFPAFNKCDDTCADFVKTYTHYLKFRWEAFGADSTGAIEVRLLDDRPGEGCTSIPGYEAKPCYQDILERLQGSAVSLNGLNAAWCFAGQKSHDGQTPLPASTSEIIKEPAPVDPRPISIAPCEQELNTQRFTYAEDTGLIRVKGGGCLTLLSDITCPDIRSLGTPMRSLNNISIPGTFANLEACTAAVLAAKFEEFQFRTSTGASYVPTTQKCFANVGSVPAQDFPSGIEFCHFGAETATPQVAVTTCSASDPRQQFTVTPQTIFHPKVAFVPPQTKGVTGFTLWLRVLYEKSTLKGMVDAVVNTLAGAGWKSLPRTSLFGQSMPLELVLPGMKNWEKASHTETSRNQLYRMSVNPVGFGKRYLKSLDMPWSMTGEDMQMELGSSDIVLERPPSESLRVEKLYLHVGYSSEQIVHNIATADMATAFSTLIAVVLASAGILACWSHVFPKGDTHHMTLKGHSLKLLNDELADTGLSAADVHDLTGIDITVHDERESCCPWIFPNKGHAD